MKHKLSTNDDMLPIVDQINLAERTYLSIFVSILKQSYEKKVYSLQSVYEILCNRFLFFATIKLLKLFQPLPATCH